MEQIQLQIYVASLKDYNNGILAGKWIDIHEFMDGDDVQEEVDNFLAERSKATGEDHEEYGVHDYNGFSGLDLSEYPDFEKLTEYAKGYETHGAAWVAYAKIADEDEMTVEKFDDRFRGSGDTAEDWAEDYLLETGEVDPNSDDKKIAFLSQYFDYTQYVSYLDSSGWQFVLYEGTVYAFDPGY